jgi:hypothetical protein
MRPPRRWAIAAVILAAGGIAWVVAPGGGKPRASVRPEHELARPRRPVGFSATDDRAFALRVGSQMGDPRSIGVSTVSSTRERALSVISPGEAVGGVSGIVAVHVIAMHGQFTDDAASPPSGQGAPKGTWLTVSLDASTGEVLDLSLTNHRPPLRRLGKVHELIGPSDKNSVLRGLRTGPRRR